MACTSRDRTERGSPVSRISIGTWHRSRSAVYCFSESCQAFSRRGSTRTSPSQGTRITQFNLATQSVPADRLLHQRRVKGTSFFGDLIQSNSVQQLATSSLVGLPQSRPRARSSGLATSTRPGRSGEDTRPGMTSGPQRTDFIVVPVPHKSSTVSSLPQQQSQSVAASVLPRDRMVPSSLFLTDNDIPLDPPTTSPNNGDPDLPDSIVNDSLGLMDDSVGLDSDLDELPSTNEAPPDVAANDTALTIPRDPLGPCSVTFGPVHDLHETHQGALTSTFKQCFTFPLGSKTVHYPPGYEDGASLHGLIIHDPLSHIPASSTSSLPTSPLQAHPDDDMILSNADRLEHQYFECQIAILCTHWNYFYKCTSLLDIKTCLDKMDARSHHLLVAFHVAYFQSQVNLELSFGQTKQNFYQLAHQGHFQYGRLIYLLITFLWHQSQWNFFLFDLYLNGVLISHGMASSCTTFRWI